MREERIEYIDSFRGIAILMVILVHSIQYEQNALILPNTFVNVIGLGARGVQLFFIISAFTLCYSFRKKYFSDNKPIISFFIRRYFRIAPMYYVGIIFYTLFALYLTNTYYSTENIVAQFLFLHELSPYWINTIVMGGWSIATEVWFYLLFPLIFLKIKKPTSISLLMIFVLALNIVIYFIVYFLFDKNIPDIIKQYLGLNVIGQLPIFLIGIALYKLVIEKKQINEFFNKKVLILLTILLFLNAVLFGQVFPDYIYCSIGLAMIVYVISQSKGLLYRIFVNKFTHLCGLISYSMYITHFAVYQILARSGILTIVPSPTFASSVINIVFRIFVVLIVTIPVSYLFYRLIEVPFQNLAKNYINKYLNSNRKT